MIQSIQSSAINFVSNKNIISDDFELAKTFTNYFERAVGKFGIEKKVKLVLMTAQCLDLIMVLMLLLKNTGTIQV